METSDAIEKLAEYRAASKEKKAERKEKQFHKNTVKIRNGFIKYMWFNALYYFTLTFALIFGIFGKISPGYVVFAPLAAIFGLQSFRGVDRLRETDGRGTVLDDGFIIIMAPLLGLLYSLFVDIKFKSFLLIMAVFLIIWLIQIFFIYFKKPDIKFASDVNLIGKEENYFSKERSIIMGLGLIFGLLITLVS